MPAPFIPCSSTAQEMGAIKPGALSVKPPISRRRHTSSGNRRTAALTDAVRRHPSWEGCVRGSAKAFMRAACGEAWLGPPAHFPASRCLQQHSSARIGLLPAAAVCCLPAAAHGTAVGFATDCSLSQAIITYCVKGATRSCLSNILFEDSYSGKGSRITTCTAHAVLEPRSTCRYYCMTPAL